MVRQASSSAASLIFPPFARRRFAVKASIVVGRVVFASLLLVSAAVAGPSAGERWETPLKKTLIEADRIRIRTGGTCHRQVALERTLLEVTDARKVREVIRMIRIDEMHSGPQCECCGSPSIEFYHGQKLILTLGCHHGRSLRWSGGWPGDARLTSESIAQLSACLAASPAGAVKK
jgi:hypothetical protein